MARMRRPVAQTTHRESLRSLEPVNRRPSPRPCSMRRQKQPTRQDFIKVKWHSWGCQQAKCNKSKLFSKAANGTLAFVAQVPAGERDEHILEAGVAGREPCELEVAGLKTL